MAKTPELLTARQACEVIGISRSTLTYWMLTARLVPAQTLEGGDRAVLHLFDPKDVQRLAAERQSA